MPFLEVLNEELGRLWLLVYKQKMRTPTKSESQDNEFDLGMLSLEVLVGPQTRSSNLVGLRWG